AVTEQDDGALLADLQRVVLRGREARLGLKAAQERVAGLERRVNGLLWRTVALRALGPLRVRRAVRGGVRAAGVLTMQRSLLSAVPLGGAILGDDGDRSAAADPDAVWGQVPDEAGVSTAGKRGGVDAAAPVPAAALVASMPAWAVPAGVPAWAGAAWGGVGAPGGLRAHKRHRDTVTIAEAAGQLVARQLAAAAATVPAAVLDGARAWRGGADRSTVGPRLREATAAWSGAVSVRALDDAINSAAQRSSAASSSSSSSSSPGLGGDDNGDLSGAGAGAGGPGGAGASIGWLAWATLRGGGSLAPSSLVAAYTAQQRRRKLATIASGAWAQRLGDMALAAADAVSPSQLPSLERVAVLADMLASGAYSAVWPAGAGGRTGLEGGGGSGATLAWALALDGQPAMGQLCQALPAAAQRGAGAVGHEAGFGRGRSFTTAAASAASAGTAPAAAGNGVAVMAGARVPFSGGAHGSSKLGAGGRSASFRGGVRLAAAESVQTTQQSTSSSLGAAAEGVPAAVLGMWTADARPGAARQMLSAAKQASAREGPEAEAEALAEAVIVTAGAAGASGRRGGGGTDASASADAALDVALADCAAWLPLHTKPPEAPESRSVLFPGTHFTAALAALAPPPPLLVSSAGAAPGWAASAVRRSLQDEGPATAGSSAPASVGSLAAAVDALHVVARRLTPG
ncbi:unnamed protein product, partial [Symbiodinium sp. KB8]